LHERAVEIGQFIVQRQNDALLKAVKHTLAELPQ
jgi:hypothetical protein